MMLSEATNTGEVGGLAKRLEEGVTLRVDATNTESTHGKCFAEAP